MDDAVGLGEQAGQQMQRFDLRIAQLAGQSLSLSTASWALIVSFSNRNVIWASPDIAFRLESVVCLRKHLDYTLQPRCLD